MLALLGAFCVLSGHVAWASDEYVVLSDAPASPALALYVPPTGLRPVAVPGSQTMPAAPPSVKALPRFPGALMPAAPQAPVAPPSFMMPTTVGSPGAQMPI